MSANEVEINTLAHEDCMRYAARLYNGFDERRNVGYEEENLHELLTPKDDVCITKEPLLKQSAYNEECVDGQCIYTLAYFNNIYAHTVDPSAQYLSTCITCMLNRLGDCSLNKFFTGVKQISPRRFNRSFSKNMNYSKGKMKCIRAILLFACLILAFLGSAVLLHKSRHEKYTAEHLVEILNKTRAYFWRKQNHPTLHRNKMLSGKKAISRTSFGNPFDPDKWNNSTANLRKHFLVLYWSKIRGHVARIQTKKEYEKDQHVWPYTYVGDTCPVSCEITNNRSRAKEADAFVVHSRLTDVWDFPPFEYLAPWILQNNENPVYTPALSDQRVMSKFNLLISYRLDSDFPSPIYPMPTLSDPIPYDQRLGDVLAVFSKCEFVRTEYMRQLMKYIDVHSYGSCLKNKDGLIGLYGQINGKYVFKDYKLVLTRFYKFSLVFMNQDCDYFVDDRLYHALESGSVPVYMGTNKIDQFLPGNLKDSIIRVSDFGSPKELADHLKYLSANETAYNEYLKWKLTGIGDLSNSIIGRWWKPKYPLFCQVCMRLSQGQLHPGLDTDTCIPRNPLDWNLYPPYGVNNIETPSVEIDEAFIYLLICFILLLFIGSFLYFVVCARIN